MELPVLVLVAVAVAVAGSGSRGSRDSHFARRVVFFAAAVAEDWLSVLAVHAETVRSCLRQRTVAMAASERQDSCSAVRSAASESESAKTQNVNASASVSEFEIARSPQAPCWWRASD